MYYSHLMLLPEKYCYTYLKIYKRCNQSFYNLFVLIDPYTFDTYPIFYYLQ